MHKIKAINHDEGSTSIIKALWLSIRSLHWIKNLLVFAPLIFSGGLWQFDFLLKTSICFFSFCFISSSIYLINDILDLRRDKLHPLKSKRPIAKGELSFRFTFTVSIIFVLLSFLFSLFSPFLVIILLLYFLLNILYSLYLKQIIILDTISVAFGYVLRVWAGAVVIFLIPSIWLQLCTFLVALFISFCKRRGEILTTGQSYEQRPVLAKYNLPFLDKIICISATASLIAYIFYTATKAGDRRLFYYSSLFVIYGIFRYLYLIFAKQKDGEPIKLLFSDKSFLINIILWLGFVIVSLY